MDVLSDNSVPLGLRTAAANASLELMNATVDYYANMDSVSTARYKEAQRAYNKMLNDLTLFYPE
jgi:hypothetical protein